MDFIKERDEIETKLLQGDCLELMKDMKDNSVDLVLVDPPYGTTINKWDKVINFYALWDEYNRILKAEGSVVIFSKEPFTTKVISSNIKNFKEKIIWLKNRSGNGFGTDQHHISVYEEIPVFSRGHHTFNPQKWLVEDKEFLTQRKTFNHFSVGNHNYPELQAIRKKDDGTRFPINIVTARIPVTQAKSKKYNNEIELRYHPTQKPIALLEYLIKTYTNENDVVLDNCMGSGSTGVACVNTNRDFIGMELDKNYFNIATERIEKAESGLQDT